MKKHVIYLAVLCALLLPWTVLAAPQVVATHAVYAEIARIVGGDAIEVEVLIPSGFCPGHYDLSPSDYAALIHADLVLYSGFEPWVEQLGERTQPGALVQIPGEWNTPEAAATQTRVIADLLSERVPEAAAAFEHNRDTYLAELDATSAALTEQAGSLHVDAIPVACMGWQVPFVSWLGFDVAVTYGLPESLSMRDLVDLAERSTSVGAVLVIDNLQSGIEFGAKLAREADAVHVVLSNFPGALPRTATLLDLFVRNAEALFTAIEPIE